MSIRGFRIASLACALLSFSACRFMQAPAVTDTNRKIASFTHSGITGTCVSCHEKDRPAPQPDGTGIMVPHGKGQDCGLCHVPGVPWLQASNVSHTPTPSSCISCHLSKRPTGPVGPAPQFNHALGGMGDCVSCHAQNAGVTWTGGQFSHAPTPTSCASCHATEVPSPSALVPPGASQDLFVHSTAFNGNADCASCHISVTANIGVKWAGGVFNHKDATSASVTTCLPCHQNQRPSGPVGTSGFDHANSGMGDCASCHTQAGVSWASGAFSHSPTPATCANCHASTRPSASTTLPAGASKDLYTHAANYNGAADCVSCHTSVPANVGVKWAGGTYNHQDGAGNSITTCQACHSSQRPIGPISSPSFDHANGGTGDCGSCHGNPGISWVNGQFSHSPTPTSCASCHANERPAPTAILPSGATIDLYEHAASYNGTADCVSCHTSVAANIGVKWAGGFYKHKNGAGNTVTSCQSCHANQRPAPTALIPSGSMSPYAHATQFNGTSDCASCHAQNIGTSWSGGYFNHADSTGAQVATCLPCHLQRGQNQHGSTVKDCGSCHAVGNSWDR